MAFTRGQVDRFGRPIPASPGYQVLINADGSEVQQRNRLILPASLVATDAEDSDASELTLSSEPADITLPANSVLGNSTGLTAPATALSATSFGLAALAAASQAALTALIAAATTSLAGLLSAADKTKLDYQGVKIYDAALSGSSVHPTWTAGLYRRLEIVLQTYTGNAADPLLTFDGFTNTFFGTAGYLANGGATGNGTGTWTQKDQWITADIALIGMGTQSLVNADISLSTGELDMTWRGTGGGGARAASGAAASGSSIDTLALTTGLTVTFGGSTVGWLTVIGYK